MSQVLWFLVASAIGAVVGAAGAAVAIKLAEPTSLFAIAWRLWFASCLLGIVTVAPLLIGLGAAVGDLPPRREMIEGSTGLVTLAAISVFLISLPQGPWATALPVALVLPLLLWFAVRCRPVFAAAASFTVALTVIWSTTFNLGHFGDASIPLADRILAAQSLVLAGALLVMILAALFAERRLGEAKLKQGKESLQLALDGAELGAFSADLATGQLTCDERAARIHGHKEQPTTIRESRRFVHPDDLVRIDAALAEAGRAHAVWRAEYRVVHPSDGKVHWVALEGSVVCNSHGKPVRLLGVTRDITHRKQSEQVLAKRNVQLTLAGKAALVGSYAYDTDTESRQVSAGYAAIYGLSEGTEETPRSQWRASVHPEDLPRLDVLRSQAFHERRREYNVEYRIVRSGGEMRWIESRSFVSYDNDGHAQRVVGVNIDVTDRKQAEQVLAERNIQLGLAAKAGLVGSYSYDADTEIMQISDGYAVIHGFPEGTSEMARSDCLAGVHPDDIGKVQQFRSEAFREGRREYDVEYRIIRPGGELRWVETRCFLFFSGAGQPQRVVGVSIDITERKLAELSLADRNKQLELAGKAALVGSFAIDVHAPWEDFASNRMQVSPASAPSMPYRRKPPRSRSAIGDPTSIQMICRSFWSTADRYLPSCVASIMQSVALCAPAERSGGSRRAVT